MKITVFSVNNRIATGVVTLAFLVLGVLGYYYLSVNLLPDIKYPYIEVEIVWEGATAEEIERNIAISVESGIASVDGLDYFVSSSVEGEYELSVYFVNDVDIDIAYQDVLASISRSTRGLPDDVENPVINKADPSQLPIAELIVESEESDLISIRSWTDNWLLNRLNAVHGIASIEILGGLIREIQVNISTENLIKYNLPLNTVVQRIDEENVQVNAGNIETETKEYIISVQGYYQTIEEIKDILIFENDYGRVYLKDIAEVVDSYEKNTEYTRYNGNKCVVIDVYKQALSNTVELTKDIQEKIDSLVPAFPDGTNVSIFNNQAVYIESSLNSVRNAILEAALILMIVVYLFLGNIRQVITMLITLPVTIIINFGVMSALGFSLNIFSLSGLVIAVGIVVDNSTVVIENITRLRSLYPEKPTAQLIIDGTKEVGPSIIASTLSFLALFIPFLLISETISLLFRELIFVIASSAIISLGVAITVTPMVMSLLISNKSKVKKKTRFEKVFDIIKEAYGKSLIYVLKVKWLVLILFAGVFVFAIFLTDKLNSEFLPKIDDGQITITYNPPAGTSLDETDRIVNMIEEIIKEESLIESYYTYVEDEAQIDIQLTPWDDRETGIKEYVVMLREKLSAIPGAGDSISVFQQMISGIPMLGDSDFVIEIKGENIDALYEIAESVKEELSTLDEIANATISYSTNMPSFQVLIDREKASALGVSVSNIAQTLNSFITGTVASEYYVDDIYYNIRVLIPQSNIRSTRDIENMVFYSDNGANVRLYELAQVVRSAGAVQIDRENQIKVININADINNVAFNEALNAVKNSLESIESSIPAGYLIEYGGGAEMMNTMLKTTLKILLFAVFFSFVILAVQFNNIKYPIQILIGIPVCLSGIIFALYVSEFTLCATVLIGLLIVVSATVVDGVLLLTFAEELRINQGYKKEDAVVQSAKIRLRPRIMTTITTITGFVPLALNLDGGGEMLQPMAIGAIGGLLLSIIVTLFLMPCIYVIITRR